MSEMKGTNIGEFEEVVLLTVAALMQDAYSVAICDELSNHTGRSSKLGVVHAGEISRGIGYRRLP
jgi:PadR family transcriptional regulator, regulatory protein PadR